MAAGVSALVLPHPLYLAETTLAQRIGDLAAGSKDRRLFSFSTSILAVMAHDPRLTAWLYLRTVSVLRRPRSALSLPACSSEASGNHDTAADGNLFALFFFLTARCPRSRTPYPHQHLPGALRRPLFW